MRKIALFLTLFSVSLLAFDELFEVRWDGSMCTISSGKDRKILRKAARNGECQFPIPKQKNCVVVGFGNAKNFRYDGKYIILTPIYEREPALGDLLCVAIR